MTVASIAEKMHILNKCIYITMYTVKGNILGKKVCWRLATNQNCNKRIAEKLGKGAYVNKCVPELDGFHMFKKNPFVGIFRSSPPGSPCVSYKPDRRGSDSVRHRWTKIQGNGTMHLKYASVLLVL